MKTKVCPICDQPIQGMYCKGCKKIILNPVEQDITYFLNTRHPEFETDCSYHNGLSGGSGYLDRDRRGDRSETVRSASHCMTEAETEAKKAEIKRRMAAGKQGTQNSEKQSGGPLYRSGAEFGLGRKANLNGDFGKHLQSGKNNSAIKKMVIGLVVYLIVCFSGIIGRVFFRIFGGF